MRRKKSTSIFLEVEEILSSKDEYKIDSLQSKPLLLQEKKKKKKSEFEKRIHQKILRKKMKLISSKMVPAVINNDKNKITDKPITTSLL